VKNKESSLGFGVLGGVTFATAACSLLSKNNRTKQIFEVPYCISYFAM
jgi:hypothetical protein